MSLSSPSPLVVLVRSEQWVVVAKPPRLLVHRSKEARADHYALQILRDQLGTQVFPIHRLDRATSGCLLFGLNAEVVPLLQGALSDEAAEKVYVAQVRGRWAREGATVIDRPIKDDHGVLREAWSEARCLGASTDPRCSLVQVRVKTGRYHQVRRHLRGLDHPVLGDSMHGDTRANRWWRDHYDLPRLALHCLRLDLPLPSGDRLQATCPLFDDLQALWSRMPWWQDALAADPELSLPALPVPDYLQP